MQHLRPTGTWRRVLMVGTSFAVAIVGLAATPALAARMTSGTGTASVSPMTVITPTASTLQLTYTAGASMTDGVVTVTVPTGWTAPTTLNATASMGTVSVVGSIISVSGVTLASGGTLTIDYGVPTSKVVPTSLGGFGTFTVAMSPTSSGTPAAIASSPVVFVYALASPTLLREVTTVPLAVFNKVGVHSGELLYPPSIAHKQRPFEAMVDGHPVPRSIFWGSEWCPYCMPASWGIIVAMSRFGTFNQFYEMFSDPLDYAPNTPGFTFHKSTYTSRWLTFAGFEQEGPFQGQTLDPPPKGYDAILHKYDSAGSWPFFDVGNVAFVASSPFDPSILDGLTQSQIGANLSKASNPETRAIIAWANATVVSLIDPADGVPVIPVNLHDDPFGWGYASLETAAAAVAKPQSLFPYKVFPYVPELDPVSNLWFVDVQLDFSESTPPPPGYFLRLNLARFQPNAIGWQFDTDANEWQMQPPTFLSPVTTLNMMQPVADRVVGWTQVSQTSVNGTVVNTIDVSVTGYSYVGFRPVVKTPSATEPDDVPTLYASDVAAARNQIEDDNIYAQHRTGSDSLPSSGAQVTSTIVVEIQVANPSDPVGGDFGVTTLGDVGYVLQPTIGNDGAISWQGMLDWPLDVDLQQLRVSELDFYLDPYATTVPTSVINRSRRLFTTTLTSFT